MELRLKDINSLLDVISEEEKAINEEKLNIIKAIDQATGKMKEEVEKRSTTLVQTLLNQRKVTVDEEKRKLESEMKGIDSLLKRECDETLVEKTDTYVAQTVAV